MRAIIAEHKGGGGRLGVEYDAYGLTAANGKRLEAALAGFAKLTDASNLVTRLRLVKSAAELAYVPLSRVAVADRETAAKVLRLIEALEDLDDVQSVYANYDIPAEWLVAPA